MLERAWKSGFDVCMLTVDTWQLGWRPTDISIANYTYARPLLLASALDGSRFFSLRRFYYPGAVGALRNGGSDGVR